MQGSIHSVDQEQAQTQKAQRPYEEPKVVTYGSVEQLTQTHQSYGHSGSCVPIFKFF